MATFIDPRDALMVPDVTAAATSGYELGRKIKTDMLADQNAAEKKAMMQADKSRMEKVRMLSSSIMRTGDRSDPRLADLAMMDQTVFDDTFKSMGLISTQQKADAAEFAYNLQRTPFDRRDDVIKQRIASLTSQGRDASDSTELLDMTEDEQKTYIDVVQMGMLPVKERLEFGTKQKIEQQELKEKTAKAEKAAIDSKFAESLAIMDLEKSGAQIESMKNNAAIARENNRIAAIRAAQGAESNAISREKLSLDIQQAEAQRDAVVKKEAAKARNGVAAIDNFGATVQKIMQTPMSTIKSAAGPVDQFFPTILPSTANFEELIKSSQAQIFMAQLPNLVSMGALSNAEGDRIVGSLQPTSLRQSPEALIENFNYINAAMIKAKKYLIANGGGYAEPQKPGAGELSNGFRPKGGQ